MKAVRDAFHGAWHLMTLRQKLKGIYLVYGFKFWSMVTGFSISMERRILASFKPNEQEENPNE